MNVAVVHAVVLAAGEDHDVPASAALHDGRARMLSYNVLCARRAPRTNAAHDQDLQQRGIRNIHCKVVGFLLCGSRG